LRKGVAGLNVNVWVSDIKLLSIEVSRAVGKIESATSSSWRNRL